MSLRPQDLLVAVKLAIGPRLTYPELARDLAMSLSEVHGAVKRATAAGLVGTDRKANRSALLEFLLRGAKYVFVPKRGQLTRGIPTAHGAPPLDQLVGTGAEPPPVWPDPDGTVRGESFAPICRSAPKAAKKDPKLYEALCLIDAIRGGRARDVSLAEQHLRRLFFPNTIVTAARSDDLFVRRQARSHSEPRRDRIFRGLARIGPGPAAFYRDALEILELERPLAATSNLVGHLAREIESAIRHVIYEMNVVGFDDEVRSKKRREYDDGHRGMIRSVLALLGIPKDSRTAQVWLEFAGKDNPQGLHKHAHRDELNSPRVWNSAFWDQFENVLEAVLDSLDRKYLMVFDHLDRLIAKQSPTKSDAEALRNRVPQGPTILEYFFSKLDSPTWIQPLEEAGFFAIPPSPIREDDAKTAYPSWPALRYLARMTSRSPEDVARIALAIPPTENLVVHNMLAEITLELPSVLAARFADKIEEWLERGHQFSSGHSLATHLVDLVEKLANADEPDAAVRVLRSLLRPRVPTEERSKRRFRDEPRARLTDRDLKIAVVKLTPAIASLGWSAFEMLAELLQEAVALAQEGASAEAWDDYSSFIWRPAIEDHARNGDDLRALLASATRDAAIHIVEKDPSRLAEIVSLFEARRWIIFRRLALFLLDHLAAQNTDLATKRLLDRAIFDEHRLDREYTRLLRSFFSRLRPKQQNEILSWIEAGPREPYAREGRSEVDRWKLSWLTAIADLLPASWRTQFEELKATYGQQPPPDDLPIVSFDGRPASPLPQEDFARMTPLELVRAVLSLKPSSDFSFGERSDLWQTVARVVEQKPDAYSQDAKILERLDPHSLFGVLGGFRSAIQANRSFDWSGVVDLCVWTMSQKKRVRPRTQEALAQSAHWTEARKAVTWLLSEGLRTVNVPIPIELRARVWSALEPGLSDPDGADNGDIRDPIGASLNHVRGSALYAAIDYARWAKEREPAAIGLPLEVSNALEVRLTDRSAATRAVFGNRISFLAYLDEDWCKKNVHKMFRLDERGRDPAWETYLSYGALSLSVFRLLQWRYKLAVDHMLLTASEADGRDNDLVTIGRHLGQLYWHGQIPLRGQESLLEAFFGAAAPAAAGRVLENLGYWLRESPGPDADVLVRLKALWMKRAAAGHKEEMRAFGQWFVSARFDDEWALEELLRVASTGAFPHGDGQVAARLESLVPKHLEKVLSCLDLLAQADDRGWGFVNWGPSASAILTAAIATGNSTSLKKAKEIIGRFLDKGYFDFRPILESRVTA